MVQKRWSCYISEFERRMQCAFKKPSKKCLNPSFLGYRCWYLLWNKEDVIKVAKKGVKEIRTFGGFTKEAINYAEKFRPKMRLVNRNEIVKSRRLKVP
jgi:hypothetical protein